MTSYPSTALVLLAKYPVPRNVKTRLVNGTSRNGYVGLKNISDKSGRIISENEAYDLAAKMYAAFLRDRFKAHQEKYYDVLLATSEPEQTSNFRSITGNLVPYHVLSKAKMGDMLFGIFKKLLTQYQFVLISSTDIPSLDEIIIQTVCSSLESHDIVLVPAEDGAYNLIGMRKLYNIFDIPNWSSGTELKDTITLLRNRKITHQVLNQYHLSDIDTVEDLAKLIKSPTIPDAPHTNVFLKTLNERFILKL